MTVATKDSELPGREERPTKKLFRNATTNLDGSGGSRTAFLPVLTPEGQESFAQAVPSEVSGDDSPGTLRTIKMYFCLLFLIPILSPKIFAGYANER